MATCHEFFAASSSAAAMARLASSSVIGGPYGGVVACWANAPVEAVPVARAKTTSAQASASIRGIFLISFACASKNRRGVQRHNKRQTRPVEAPENEMA